MNKEMYEDIFAKVHEKGATEKLRIHFQTMKNVKSETFEGLNAKNCRKM